MRAQPLLPLLLVLALAACSSSEVLDSGLIRPDSGVGADASAEDAGEEVPDSGLFAPDAGFQDAAVQDAGSEDAGVVSAGPIEAPAETWTWVPFPDSHCINGSPTGIGVNILPGATKVMIFLMGGNACFNQASCFVTANLDGYGEAKFNNDVRTVEGTPAFDRTRDENIFKDASYVYVPYCTGDVHAGSNMDGQVAGSRYTFMGYDNMRQYLDRLVATFPGATEVVLTGVSAGGFGAMLNFDQVQRAFGSGVRVTLIDDSGPPMTTEYLAACLQAHFRATWGFDEGVLAGCADCLATPDQSFIEPYFDYLMGLYADRNFAVISSDGDDVIRGFWGFGRDQCSRLNDFLPPAYPAATFRLGLESFRDEIAMGRANVGLFMKTGSARHVWLAPDPIWTITQDGVTLSDWLDQAIRDDAAWTHVPAP